jgi:hypothetical protein
MSEPVDKPQPCTFYGVPCEVGTEGNCVCRRRFFIADNEPKTVSFSAALDPTTWLDAP